MCGCGGASIWNMRARHVTMHVTGQWVLLAESAIEDRVAGHSAMRERTAV